MGLQEIQNERFENSEVMGKYWPKQDSEVLKLVHSVQCSPIHQVFALVRRVG